MALAEINSLKLRPVWSSMFNQWKSTKQVLEQDMGWMIKLHVSWLNCKYLGCDERHKFFLLLENESLSLESTCGKPDLDSPLFTSKRNINKTLRLHRLSEPYFCFPVVVSSWHCSPVIKRRIFDHLDLKRVVNDVHLARLSAFIRSFDDLSTWSTYQWSLKGLVLPWLCNISFPQESG